MYRFNSVGQRKWVPKHLCTGSTRLAINCEPVLSISSELGDIHVNREYKLIFNDEIGCSYMGAWLGHINLFRAIPYWVDISRAEAASTEVFKRLPNKYIFVDPNTHYVHHLSKFEHENTEKYGFAEAQRKSSLLASSSSTGECAAVIAGKGSIPSTELDSLAIIPFYGGLPPNGTAHSSDSLGQGNSKVDANTKALQCLATICSCLRYFGHVIVGVSRTSDRLLLVDKLNDFPGAKHFLGRVTIIEFSVPRPIVQVFHLMVWTQHYLKFHNCWRFQDHCYNQHSSQMAQRRRLKKTPWWKGKLKRLFFNESSMKINISLVENHQRQAEIAGYPVRVIHEHPLRYIYYTEADQIVRFDSIETLHAVKAASNATTYFLGRRREKWRDGDPIKYMDGLRRGPQCGRRDENYILEYPKSRFVYRQWT
eukprot:gene29394-38483_t